MLLLESVSLVYTWRRLSQRHLVDIMAIGCKRCIGSTQSIIDEVFYDLWSCRN